MRPPPREEGRIITVYLYFKRSAERLTVVTLISCDIEPLTNFICLFYVKCIIGLHTIPMNWHSASILAEISGVCASA